MYHLYACPKCNRGRNRIVLTRHRWVMPEDREEQRNKSIGTLKEQCERCKDRHRTVYGKED